MINMLTAACEANPPQGKVDRRQSQPLQQRLGLISCNLTTHVLCAERF